MQLYVLNVCLVIHFRHLVGKPRKCLRQDPLHLRKGHGQTCTRAKLTEVSGALGMSSPETRLSMWHTLQFERSLAHVLAVLALQRFDCVGQTLASDHGVRWRLLLSRQMWVFPV